jgi:PilZ domain
VGLQCLESGEWIWEDLRLPLEDTDVYTRPPESKRRLVSRSPCFLSTEVVWKGRRVLALIRDLSLGGCYIATSLPFPVESIVFVAIWLDESIKVWLDGVVISNHAGVGMGIKFLGLPGATSNAIDRCLKSFSKEENPTPVRVWLPDTHRQ